MTRFDEIFAGSVLIERVEDNGDGTGTRTVYDADGNVTSTEQLTDLPIPAEPEPTVEEQLAELQALLDALLGEGE